VSYVDDFPSKAYIWGTRPRTDHQGVEEHKVNFKRRPQELLDLAEHRANVGYVCGLIATARRLGIPTVSVFSEIDRGSRHVAMADRAFCIGTAPALDSYLNQDRILEASLRENLQQE
jgi:hypothetical protein